MWRMMMLMMMMLRMMRFRVMMLRMRGRMMMLRMMMSRGRKRMMWRMMMSSRRKRMILRMLMRRRRRRTDPKTALHVLYEPARSKCTSTFRKSHFAQEFTGKLLHPRLSPECARTHTRTHLLAHFVRACPVEMHVNTSHEPLYTDIAGKMPRPRLRPERRYTHCASLRSRSACQHFTKATLYGHLQEKCRGPEPGPALCASLQSKCMSTFHKGHFIRTFAGKMPRPRSGTRTLCEPARSKCWSTFHKSHFTRKFTGKMPRPRSGTRTLCELAVEMHVNISQESLHTEVYRKNAAAQNRDPHFVRACSRNFVLCASGNQASDDTSIVHQKQSDRLGRSSGHHKTLSGPRLAPILKALETLRSSSPRNPHGRQRHFTSRLSAAKPIPKAAATIPSNRPM